MRITYLSVSGQMGGAETSLLQLLASVRAAQPAWSLSLILGADGPLASKAAALGIRTEVVSLPPDLASLGDSSLLAGSKARLSATLQKAFSLIGVLWKTRCYSRVLSSRLKSLNPDLIHTTGMKMHLIAVWARSSAIPVVWHIQDYVGSRPLMRRLINWHASRCAAILVCSRSVRNDILQSCSSSPDVICLYNSVDLIRFSPVGPTLDLDAIAGMPPAAQSIVRVGLPATFAKWKGHRTFLKALSLLPPDLPLRAYIIGGPIYQTHGSQRSIDELKAEADRLGLTGRVGFTGFVDCLETAIRSLDIVVHASTQPEPFGMVIVEGMACGKSVIASDASGASELFTDGVDVMAYPCGNPQALANQIVRLVTSADLRARTGIAAHQSVSSILEGSRLATELLSVYHDLILIPAPH